MRLFIGFVLILLAPWKALAQPALIQHTPKDISSLSIAHIDRLNNLSFENYLRDPDSSRKIAEEALILAEKTKYQAGIGQSLLNIGHVYWSQSHYPVALFYLKKAIENLPAGKPLLISDCYDMMARTYADLGNYKEAANNMDMAEHFAGNDIERLAEVHSERSYIYMLLKNYDQAIEEAQQGLALDNLIKNQKGIAVFYGRLSQISRCKKLYSAALAYSDTTYRMSVAIHNNRLRSKIYIEYALNYEQLHNFDKAILYANKGAALADSVGIIDVMTSAYKTLTSIYELKGDLKQAIAYQKLNNKMEDSLGNFEKSKNAQLIQDYFVLNARLNQIASVERNEAEIKARMHSQRVTIIILALALLIVIAILSVTWYFYKQKQQLNNKLRVQHAALLKQKQLIEVQTANLENVNKIKDKLLAVIGHDLRTPLSNLRNIAEMFELGYLTVNEMQMLMKDVSPVVKGAELTLSNLMDWAGNHIKGRTIYSSRLDIFLIGVEMEQTFNHALQRKKIEFINQANPGQSVLADENHIKVVLRNLISNAIKFTDMNGCIKLNSAYEENKVVISIEDNGKGMSAEEISMLFYLQTHFTQPGTLGENGTGIGLLLCKELVELNGGKLWIKSSPGKGSKFCFSLPLNAEYA